MKKWNTLALAAFAAVTLGACDLDSVVDDLESSAIDSAFQVIQDNARQQGGDAVLVRPGSDYTLEITDPNSPINGAKVVVPAAAIPADVEQAAVAIYGINAGGTVSTDAFKLAGPVATVAFTKIPGGEKIEPLANFTITLPYAEAATRPAEQMVLANVNQDATITVFEDNSAAGAKVTAGSKSFDRFGPFWQVDFDGTAEAPEDSLIYKVTSADGSKACAGLIDNVSQIRLTEKRYLYQAGYGFKFLVVAAPLTIDTLLDATAAPAAPPVGTTLDVALDGPYGSWQLTCIAADGTALGGSVATHTTLALTVGNWVETSAGASETCAVACTPYTGALDIDATLDYVADDGSAVKAKLNTRVSDFVWYQNDI